MVPRYALLAFLLLGLFARSARAQPADTSATPSYALPEVTVEAIREAETARSAPVALTIEQLSPAEVALTPSLSLDDVLRPLAGVWVNDRHHFALGERISVRGVGYRSNFGVRGIQVVYDGIPLTLPDGQAFLDVVDPGVVRRVELVRTPASVFWGNGSGGVLFLSSEPPGDSTFTRVRGQAGRYGQQQGLIETQLRTGGTGTLHAYASSVWQDGYRAHSEGRRTRWGANWRTALSDQTRLTLTVAGNQQDTENPSSLTQEQFQQDPSQARSAFLEVNAGKQSWQNQVGVSIEHTLGGGTLSGTGYYLVRSLDNPLSFGYITYDRQSGGGRVTLRRTEGRLEGGVGLDVGAQRDDRLEYSETVDGDPGDTVALDQVETVLSASAFGYLRWNVTERFAATGGLRVDGLRFDANDQLTEPDGDQSGERTFSAWSPAVGLAYDLGPAQLFAHYSTAFETPTASELSNQPGGGGGFNQQISPQWTRSLEVGTRGALPSARLQFDVALYRLQIDDLISSFEDVSGRELYRNLGANTHSGIEAALTWTPTPPLEIAARYTGSRFVIDEADDPAIEGNRVPGIPDHRGYLHVQAERNGWWGRVSTELVPEYYVNNANTDTAPSYALLNVELGHRGIDVGAAQLQPFAGVNNLLDEQYAGSVVVNAFDPPGPRLPSYYEPAPGITYSVGLNVEL
jgi:iron complex outermembrane receptor protein